MVWGNVKMALKRANIFFTRTTLKTMVADQFVKKTAQEWPTHVDALFGGRTLGGVWMRSEPYTAVCLCYLLKSRFPLTHADGL